LKRLLVTLAILLVTGSFAFAGFERTLHYQFDVLSPAAQNLETGLSFDYANEGDWMKTWVIDVYAKYGLTDNWELGANYPYINWDIDNGPSEDGFGDLNIWTKYRLFSEEKDCFGLAGGVNVKLATGSDGSDPGDKHLGTGHVDWMPFVMGTIRPAEQLTFGGKVGYNLVSNDDLVNSDHEWRYGLWGGYALQDNLSIVAELTKSNNGNGRHNDDPMALDAGITYAMAENFGLTAGAGVGLNSAAPDWHVFAGIKANFPFGK
jgi:hypothetical protein